MSNNKSIYEIGDNLESLALKARKWFNENDVEIPAGVQLWQKSSARRGEIPTGTNIGALRRYGFNCREFLGRIKGTGEKGYAYDPIKVSNIIEKVGLSWISSTLSDTGHASVLTKCTACNFEEVLLYGTLQRMVTANNRLCRMCRGVGGKSKPLSTYDIFSIVEKTRRTSGAAYVYKCHTCENTVERSGAHVYTAEYLVCEYCNPHRVTGNRISTELGNFDSKIEYEAYKTLLILIPEQGIQRQVKYDDLFNTGTKHTADFYIESLSLVLEITTANNGLGQKYNDTMNWKLSLSDTVVFAFSLKEVEDIVRSKLKGLELTATNS